MSYAGDLTPAQAWEKVHDGAQLVDVRTLAEWEQIGTPVLEDGQSPLFIQWNLAGGIRNPEFLSTVQANVPAGTPIVFLCRSGQRSIGAAQDATAAGYPSYNVLEGFEGVPGASGQRDVNGWKNSGLPVRAGLPDGFDGVRGVSSGDASSAASGDASSAASYAATGAASGATSDTAGAK